ncbi:MAG: MFS transporter, partial [Ignavibacteriaceae bacterium]
MTNRIKVGNVRWTIVALIFFATTINYIDRQVIGILAPFLQKEIGWNEIEYGYIVTAFSAAYAIGLLLIGRIIDIVGTRSGYSTVLTGWSFAAITGIFNAGSNVGAVIAPLIVPWIVLTWGWQEAFIFTGAIGLIWLIFWYWLYDKPEKHKKLSQTELEYIQSDPADPSVKIPWKQLLKYRGTWAFAIGKFLTDPAWWFYLYWIPSFLNKNYGVTLDKIGVPLIIIYVMADVGSIGGGWLSSSFIKQGWTVNKGRKITMLICAIIVIPIMFASGASSIWVAVGLLSLATAAHQGWSANLFTIVSDMFPRKAVASVVGLGGTFGAIGGMFIATAAGFILEYTGS